MRRTWLLVAGLATVGVLFIAVFPARTYLDQHRQRQEVLAQIKSTDARNRSLEQRIRTDIRRHASPRHVPARIAQVPDIPRTKNGKVVELAVKSVVHGMPVGNTDALANPEALEYFRNLPELAT